MNLSKRPPLSAREAAILSGLMLGSLIVLAVWIGANIRWSALLPGGDRFFTIYTGARAFLFQTGDAYGRESALAAQALTDEDPGTREPDAFRLTLPFFLVPLVFPVALIPDPIAARGFWAFLGQVAVISTVFLSLHVIGWPQHRILPAIITLAVIFSFYVVDAMLDGNPVVLLALAYTAILRSLESGHDELAGALLVLCLWVWEAGLLFLILVTWRVFHEKRWRVLAGFGMTLVVLLGLAFLLFPGWVLPFLTASIGAIRAAHGTSTAEILLRLSPDHGGQISSALTILVLATLIYEWAVARESDFRRFVWLAFLVLAATPLLGFRSETSNLAALTPALVLIASAAFKRRPTGAWLGVMLLAFIFALPWYLDWRRLSLHATRAQDILFMFLPMICLVGMYWTRWWFLKPARTWLDEIRAAAD